MTTLGSQLLALALLAPTAPPETAKAVDYESELNDKLQAGIKPGENAAALLIRAFGPKPEGSNMPAGYYKRLGVPEPPEHDDYLISIGKFVKDHLQLEQDEWDDVYKQQGWASARPWSAKQYPFISAWVKQNEKPLALVLEAVKRPKYYNPLVSKKSEQDGQGSIIGVLLPTVQKCREIASLLTARAMQRLEEGKVDEAWADLQACHRLARHVAHGGTLIELLVGVAIDAIASNADLAFLDNAKLTSRQLSEKLKDIQSLPPFPQAAEKVDLTERYCYLDCLRLVRGNGFQMLQGLGGGKVENATEEEKKALGAIDWSPAEEAGRKWYDRMVAAMRKPNRAERNRELEGLEAELKSLKDKHEAQFEQLRKALTDNPKAAGPTIVRAMSDVLLALVCPGVRKVQDASDRQTQIHANLQAAFAVAAYRQEHGKYPAKLGDLAPKFIAKVPGDVFTGGALMYQPSDTGFLLYSVGANGMDDGGRWFDDEPRGDDPRVRIPLPPLKKDE